MKVEHIAGDDAGAFVVNEGGQRVAELTYVVVAGQVRLDHTRVDASLRGRGVAGSLMKEAVRTAREHKWTVVPECSYTVRAFEQHPEWADLLPA